MTVKFELEDDEAAALMQCASIGTAALQAFLGAQARPMLPIFNKIQAQFNEQRPTPATPARSGDAVNGRGAEAAA